MRMLLRNAACNVVWLLLLVSDPASAQDCDGVLTCGLGICDHSVPKCIGGVPQGCNPMQGAMVEVCNGLDDDCDGQTDELGAYVCGVGDCRREIPWCVNGKPNPCNPMLGATDEVCDGRDNDCDGEVDEGLGQTSCGVGECLHIQDNCVNGQSVACDPFKGVGPEVCDGRDNDCDGEVDNVWPPISCGVGECHRILPACTGGAVTLCDPFWGSLLELCDGLDNDCDGMTDEDLGTYVCGEGECQRVLSRCESGEYSVCDPFLGASGEGCDGLDNDCNGLVDDGLGYQQCGTGRCLKVVPNCTHGQPVLCDPMAGAISELCNGIDDDCDGETDEELGNVTCGVGACYKTKTACINGVPQYCNAFEGMSPEVCDGVDNNCDGLTDEGQGNTTCGLGACTRSVENCVEGVPQSCDPFLGATPEVCDGLDNDCNGLVDDGLGISVCGIGECRVEVPNCLAGVPQGCIPLPPQPEVCDGLDNNCDGDTDEGFGVVSCGLGPCYQEMEECVFGVPQQCSPFLMAEPEVCDGLDNDCNGLTDDGLGSFSCGVGVCQRRVHHCIAGISQDCDPLVGAAAETCNGLDDDCNGLVDDGLGQTVCGLGECRHAQDHCVKGVPVQCDPMKGSSVELCDGLDNDCDGEPDEDGVCEVPMCPSGSFELCDDDDPCTYGDQCDGEGNCVGTPHSSCLPDGERDQTAFEEPLELLTWETDGPDPGEVEPSVPRSEASGGCHHRSRPGGWWMFLAVLWLLVVLRFRGGWTGGGPQPGGRT